MDFSNAAIRASLGERKAVVIDKARSRGVDI